MPNIFSFPLLLSFGNYKRSTFPRDHKPVGLRQNLDVLIESVTG
jgi:hypothetical protein